MIRYLFDQEKSQACLAKHGCTLEDAIYAVVNELGGGLIDDDPEQFLAIGMTQSGKLVTVCYEIREDDIGPYFWLVTLWKTTLNEKKRYMI